MGATKQGDKWRCKPFTWLAPLNKGPMFMLMARRNSQTLKNLLDNAAFSIATVPASAFHAQYALMTTAPGPKTRLWPVAVQKGMTVPIAAGALVAAECFFCGYSDILGSFPQEEMFKVQGDLTHVMVLGRIESLTEAAAFDSPLLHRSGKVFASSKEFEVEGF